MAWTRLLESDHVGSGSVESERKEVSQEELLKRGRLAYQALQFQEQAARYRAAAAQLLEAIGLAEGGDPMRLVQLLESQGLQPGTQAGLNPAFDDRFSSLPVHDPLLDSPRRLSTESGLDSGDAKLDLEVDADTCKGLKRESSSALATQERFDSNALSGPTASDSSALVDTSAKGIDPPKSKSSSSRLEPERKAPVSKRKKEPSVKRSDSVQAKSNRARSSRSKTSNRLGVGVWISVAIHAIVLIGLGVCVIQVIQKQEVMSIVAATMEADNVLLETPMESESQIESMLEDVSAIPSPTGGELGLNVDVPSPTVGGMEAGVAMSTAGSGLSRELSGTGASGGKGAPGSKMVEGAEFFGSKAVGNRFVYVVDASPSMRRDRAFEAAKEEIFRSLQSMKPKQRFAILFFGGEVQGMDLISGETAVGKNADLIPATKENLEKAIHWLQKTQPQKDGRPPVDAIRNALEFEPDGIFLLFDGDTKLDNWTSLIRRMNRSEGFLSDGSPEVPIHVIHFFREEFQQSMQNLAQENAGTYRFVPKPTFRSFP